MKEISVFEINDNLFKAVGKDWMLVTAGNRESFNMMTASWGGFGWLWNRPVAFVFVRPERYTHDFIERSNTMTLSFLEDGHREILNLCGTKSGRDIDKIKATGLAPVFTESGNVLYAQARLSLECRKLFKVGMEKSAFIDASLLDRFYNAEEGNLHDIYIVGIEKVWVR